MRQEDYMRRCFEIAGRGLGYTGANPVVGAVLVHAGRIIGEGWHRRWGGPHAEVECFDAVLPADRTLISESTLYVSLEPCAHWGKQPPCAHRIVQERVRRVVVSVDDPNLQVSGRGYAILEEAGVEVQRGVLTTEGRWIARRFLSLHEQRRPWVVLKWAESADGFLAPPEGHRVMLSGPVSQRLVHKWRTEEAAILVGYRTALLDDPLLTARRWPGLQPARIVLDPLRALPDGLKLFSGDSPARRVVRPGREQPGDLVAADLPALLVALAAEGLASIIVEGGAGTLQKFISAGLWDEARIFSTPVALRSGVQAPRLTNGALQSRHTVGADTLHLWTRATA